MIVWCFFCARVGLHRPATCTVDGDPACKLCADREAAFAGCDKVPLRREAQSAPQPLPEPKGVPQREETATPAPVVEPANQEAIMAVKSSHRGRIPDSVKVAIRNAAADVTHAELARQYGISDVSVLKIRRGGSGPKAREKKTATVAIKKPEPLPTTAREVVATPVHTLQLSLIEQQLDLLWAKMPATSKAAAIQAALLEQVAR
jgi:hypothetical protein